MITANPDMNGYIKNPLIGNRNTIPANNSESIKTINKIIAIFFRFIISTSFPLASLLFWHLIYAIIICKYTQKINRKNLRLILRLLLLIFLILTLFYISKSSNTSFKASADFFKASCSFSFSLIFTCFSIPFFPTIAGILNVTPSIP